MEACDVTSTSHVLDLQGKSVTAMWDAVDSQGVKEKIAWNTQGEK